METWQDLDPSWIPDHEYADSAARGMFRWVPAGTVWQGRHLRAVYLNKVAEHGLRPVSLHLWNKALTRAGFFRRVQDRHVTWTKPDI